MPADRFIHPRLGHSEKVTMLTDLDFRVWVQYILSADDFGVMRRSPVTLQAANDHLLNRPKKAVDRCLDALVKSGLLLAFDHQGRAYVCQWDWQYWQKVDYPRPTLEPKPQDSILEQCCPLTRKLFTKHPGGTANKKPKDSQTFSENSEESSRQIPDYAGGRAREEATANGSGLVVLSSEGVQGEVTARSKRPIYRSDRFVVFEWQLEDLSQMLGPHVVAFDLHAFFDDLSRQSRESGEVLPADRDELWAWLKGRVSTEARRRGLPMAAVIQAPTNKRVAGAMAGAQAFLQRRQS